MVMQYVVYDAPWASGSKPFTKDKKGDRLAKAFVKDLIKTHKRELDHYDSYRKTWRGHQNIQTFKLTVTFKTIDLWTQDQQPQ